MSHLKQTLDLVAQLRSEVCTLLRINSNKYDELFFESGCLYLDGKFTPEYVALLRSHRLFWAWWKVEYTIKDREFIRHARKNIDDRTQKFYLTTHIDMRYRPGDRITSTIMKQKADN